METDRASSAILRGRSAPFGITPPTIRTKGGAAEPSESQEAARSLIGGNFYVARESRPRRDLGSTASLASEDHTASRRLRTLRAPRGTRRPCVPTHVLKLRSGATASL